MKYDFNVKVKNIPCHLDVARDIKRQQNGIFTVTLRVNQQLIQDYVNYYNPATSEYSAILNAAEPECKISCGGGDVGAKG